MLSVKNLKTERKVREPKDKPTSPMLKSQEITIPKNEKKAALTSRKMQNFGNKITSIMPNCNETRKENDSPKLNIDRICTPNFENALEKIDKNLK